MAARQYVPGGSSKTGLSRTRSLGVLPCGKLVPGRCAGINRHVVETESVLQEKNSKPSWPRVLRVSSRGGIRSVTRGIGGLGYGASKNLNPLRANIAETLSPALITEQGENGNQNERESKAERICLGQPAASSPAPARPNPDVVADARRRSFSLDYKLRILKEAEAVKAIGGILALDDMAPGA